MLLAPEYSHRIHTYSVFRKPWRLSKNSDRLLDRALELDNIEFVSETGQMEKIL